MRHHAHRLAILLALACTGFASAAGAATITIVNNDGANEGFNDPTPASPVGGNNGTTVGQQRLNVFQYAANVWGAILPSSVEIRVNSQFNAQTCTATSGVLGSAGPTQVFRDFAGAPFAATWYHVALANRLANSDLAPGSNDINATFNSAIGGSNCLPQGWYYGFDGNEGAQIDLLPVVLHELGHGLGFSTTTNGQTGTQMNGLPSVYDRYLFDKSASLHWNQMTDAQRAASGINCQNLVWDGPQVMAHAAERLGPRPLLHVNAPAAIAGDYNVGAASFGPTLTPGGVSGNVVLVVDNVGLPNNGCETIVNGAQLAGNIALVDRGACGFAVKVKNIQNAGAIAVIVADSVAGCPPNGMGGTDPTITIPAVRVTQDVGATLKANLAAGLNVTMRVDPAQFAGADAQGRVLIYTPNPYQGGSSVSHWDTSAEPSLLMEPAITGTLSTDVDLTRQHFADIGWFQGLLAAEPNAPVAVQLGASVPNPTPRGATISYTLAREEDVDLGIYDLTGRLVAKLVERRMPQGTHSVRWDGTDRDGRALPAGVYQYRLRTDKVREAKTLVIVR